jgi:hypothetical protein
MSKKIAEKTADKNIASIVEELENARRIIAEYEEKEKKTSKKDTKKTSKKDTKKDTKKTSKKDTKKSKKSEKKSSKKTSKKSEKKSSKKTSKKNAKKVLKKIVAKKSKKTNEKEVEKEDIELTKVLKRAEEKYLAEQALKKQAEGREVTKTFVTSSRMRYTFGDYIVAKTKNNMLVNYYLKSKIIPSFDDYMDIILKVLTMQVTGSPLLLFYFANKKNPNKLTYRTLHAKDITKENIQKYLNGIESDIGSDKQEDLIENYNIVLDKFSVITLYTASARKINYDDNVTIYTSKIIPQYYECKCEDEDEKCKCKISTCTYNVIRYLIEKHGNSKDKEELKSLDVEESRFVNLIKMIKGLSFKVDIIRSYPKLNSLNNLKIVNINNYIYKKLKNKNILPMYYYKGDDGEVYREAEEKEMEKEEEKEEEKEIVVDCSLDIFEDENEVDVKNERVDIVATIAYDNINEHIYLLDGEPKIRDNVYLDLSLNVLLKDDEDEFTKIMTWRELSDYEKENKMNPKNKLGYITFDIETVIDFKSRSFMKPYSLSFSLLTESELRFVEIIDRLYKKENENHSILAEYKAYFEDIKYEDIDIKLEVSIDEMKERMNGNFSEEYEKLKLESELALSNIEYEKNKKACDEFKKRTEEMREKGMKDDEIIKIFDDEESARESELKKKKNEEDEKEKKINKDEEEKKEAKKETKKKVDIDFEIFRLIAKSMSINNWRTTFKDFKKLIEEKYTVCYVGDDCVSRFVRKIYALSRDPNYFDTSFVLQTFNGASFDNFFLYKAYCDEKDSDDYDEQSMNKYNIMYVNNQILSIKIDGVYYSHDVRKFLPFGTLRDLCSSYKIVLFPKLELNHYLIQKKYNKYSKDNDEDGFMELMKNDKNMIQYNNYDVLSCATLWKRFQITCESIDMIGTGCDEELGKYMKNTLNKMTIGSYAQGMMDVYWKSVKYNVKKLDIKWYNRILQGRIGGRVDIFYGVKKILKKALENEELYSLDVCSLYPYVMAVMNAYYPKGNWYETNLYNEDGIGFYTCDVDQSLLKELKVPYFLCKKTKEGNDYNVGQIEKITISNQTINYLREIGCHVDVYEGIHFTGKIESSELYKPILILMQIKNIQDEYKKTGDTKYNECIREFVKLLMNSLSGKANEGLHERQTKRVTLAEYELLKEKESESKIDKLNIIDVVGNDIYCSYERHTKDLLKKQKNICVGALIYEYSRIYMHKAAIEIGMDRLYYLDTDALKTDEEGMRRFMKFARDQLDHTKTSEKYDVKFKDIITFDKNRKTLGTFEDEFEGIKKATNYGKKNEKGKVEDDKMVLYTLQKKVWMMCILNKINEIKKYMEKGKEKEALKWKAKGVNKNSCHIPEDSKFIKKKTHKDGSSSYKLDIYDSEGEIIQEKMEELYDYVNDENNTLCNNKNVYNFFEEVIKNKRAFLIRSNFSKIAGNMKKKVDLGDEDKYNKDVNNIKYDINLTVFKIEQDDQTEFIYECQRNYK